MDAKRFDQLTRDFASRSTRRRVLSRIAAAAFGVFTVASVGVDQVDAGGPLGSCKLALDGSGACAAVGSPCVTSETKGSKNKQQRTCQTSIKKGKPPECICSRTKL